MKESMQCPECKTLMVDDYEEVGNGRLVTMGNVFEDGTKEVASWFCQACHVVVVETV